MNEKYNSDNYSIDQLFDCLNYLVDNSFLENKLYEYHEKHIILEDALRKLELYKTIFDNICNKFKDDGHASNRVITKEVFAKSLIIEAEQQINQKRNNKK